MQEDGETQEMIPQENQQFKLLLMIILMAIKCMEVEEDIEAAVVEEEAEAFIEEVTEVALEVEMMQMMDRW